MALYKGLWSRWHRFDSNGVKYIKRFAIGETPVNDSSFSNWIRGTGPLSESHYNNVAAAMRKIHLGIPKKAETKYKMRLAKLGKPKSEEHKRNMSIAQQKRIYKKEDNAERQSGQET